MAADLTVEPEATVTDHGGEGVADSEERLAVLHEIANTPIEDFTIDTIEFFHFGATARDLYDIAEYLCRTRRPSDSAANEMLSYILARAHTAGGAAATAGQWTKVDNYVSLSTHVVNMLRDRRRASRA